MKFVAKEFPADIFFDLFNDVLEFFLKTTWMEDDEKVFENEKSEADNIPFSIKHLLNYPWIYEFIKSQRFVMLVS